MDGYQKQRKGGGEYSGSLVVVAATDDTTLVTVKTNHTIYVQRVKVTITTGSGTLTWSVEDSAGTPVSITGSLSAATAPVSYEFDYGQIGIALTAGKNLVLNVSAAGAAGIVTYAAYQKLTTVAAA